MQFRSGAPAPPLDTFVDYFWELRDTPSHAQESIVATGTMELVVNLKQDEFRVYSANEPARSYSGVMLSGAYRRPFVVDTKAHAAIVGVHFKPGGAAAFLKVPPGALADRHVELEILWGQRAHHLREALCEASRTEQRFAILARALREKLRSERERHGTVRFAIAKLELGLSVGEVCEQVGLCRRRLIEVFSAEVGMTPKLFARVRRFQRAFEYAKIGRKSWAAIALECGYADQSHLIRDFKDFGGLSPAELTRRQEGVKEHHVALTKPARG